MKERAIECSVEPNNGTKFGEIDAHSFFEHVLFSTRISEIEAHSSYENGKRALALAHAIRVGHSGGSPWVEQTYHFCIFFCIIHL